MSAPSWMRDYPPWPRGVGNEPARRAPFSIGGELAARVRELEAVNAALKATVAELQQAIKVMAQQRRA